MPVWVYENVCVSANVSKLSVGVIESVSDSLNANVSASVGV